LGIQQPPRRRIGFDGTNPGNPNPTGAPNLGRLTATAFQAENYYSRNGRGRVTDQQLQLLAADGVTQLMVLDALYTWDFVGRLNLADISRAEPKHEHGADVPV
jgi:hypothetical protein